MKKGFTLIELLVIVAIIILLTGLLLTNYRGGDKQLALRRSASKLAQDLRGVQEMAMSAKEVQGSIPYGFGVYFNISSPDSYILFADLNNSHNRDAGDSDLEPPIKLESNIVISTLSPVSTFSIVFTPPDPTVWINGISSGVTAQITLVVKDGSAGNQIISANNSGLIFVSNVPPPPVFDFSLSASPSSGSVTQGSSLQSTITATLVSGISQAVAFSASSGLPPGASASFSPTSCNPTCTTQMTISTGGSTPTGTSVITITGTGGSVTRTTNYSLTVNAIPTGLVADWQMDEGSGTLVNDATANNNDGTLTGGPSWTAGVSGTAVNFDGINDYMDAGSGASLNITGAITLEAWVNMETVTANSPFVIARTGTGWATWDYGIFVDTVGGGNGRWGAHFSNGVNDWNQVTKNQSVTPGIWQHIAATYDGVSVANLYINGVLANTNTYAITMPSRPTDTTRIANNGGAYYLDGIVDKARIYNRVLSAAEILAEYNNR